ncbi:MAG TPA: hypothetical protein VGJ92_08405 [Methanocella sp.]
MKIYVRERMLSKEGSRTPRFRIVATEGGDLRFHADHVRKVDLETIAGDLNAQVVYLPGPGEGESKEKKKEHKTKRAK